MKPTSPQTQSPLFSIPSETRLNIYSFLIPNNTLDINLCQALSASNAPTPNDSPYKRRPPLSSFARQLNILHTMTQLNGLHLLHVCQRTRSEALALFTKTVIRFHCPKCFKTFLPNAARGFGVGVEWMKQIEIVVDLDGQPFDGPRMHHALQYRRANDTAADRAMVREVMQSCRKEGWIWWGCLYLSERERWKYEVMEVEGDESKDEMEIVPAEARISRKWLVMAEFDF